MPKNESLREIWSYMRRRKAYWLVPFVVVLALFGLLLLFASPSAVAPFIYTLF